MDSPNPTVPANPIRRWTPAELSMLRQLAQTEGPEVIAARLARSVMAVRTKAAHERISLLANRTTATGRGVATG
jgi:hypothetical protein